MRPRGHGRFAGTPPIKTAAAFVASDFLKGRPGLGTQAVRAELALQIESALSAAVDEEREACATLCDAQSALWTSTEGKAGIPEQARRDAVARSNEATHLADAIRACYG